MHQTLVEVGHVSLVADVVLVIVWFVCGHLRSRCCTQRTDDVLALVMRFCVQLLP